MITWNRNYQKIELRNLLNLIQMPLLYQPWSKRKRKNKTQKRWNQSSCKISRFKSCNRWKTSKVFWTFKIPKWETQSMRRLLCPNKKEKSKSQKLWSSIQTKNIRTNQKKKRNCPTSAPTSRLILMTSEKWKRTPLLSLKKPRADRT